MPGPVASKVILPLDTGNTGKLVRTQTKQVGAETVHEHFFVVSRQAVVLGIYGAVSALQSVQAAAQNATATGFLWAHVPTAITGKKARLRRLIARHNTSAATPTMPTLPRIGLARFTFTGTASGAAITPAKIDSGAPAPVLDLRTAVTGLSVTLGALLAHTLVPAFILAGTAANVQQTVNTFEPIISIATDEDEWPVIAPGEGLCLYQIDAGTTADIRRFTFEPLWDEIDTA